VNVGHVYDSTRRVPRTFLFHFSRPTGSEGEVIGHAAEERRRLHTYRERVFFLLDWHMVMGQNLTARRRLPTLRLRGTRPSQRRAAP
jgi:hypothetical protein